MKEKIGFVMLGGRKILITVRDGNTSYWVTMRSGEAGPHLAKIERALKKKNRAAEKLLDWKGLAI